MSASFAAAYTLLDGCPKPDPELVLTITPLPWRHMYGAAYLIMAK